VVVAALVPAVAVPVESDDQVVLELPLKPIPLPLELEEVQENRVQTAKPLFLAQSQ